MLDLDILAVGDDGAVLIAVGAVQAVGQVAGRAQAVIHKVKEGGVVGAVHVHVLAADIVCDVVGVGVHRVLQRQRTGVVALAGPVDAAIIAVAVGTVVVVQLAVVVVDGVLLHDNGLALMDIERLPGQDQAEELVAARADGADLADGLIIGKDRHETGDAALDLDLKQDVGLGQTARGSPPQSRVCFPRWGSRWYRRSFCRPPAALSGRAALRSQAEHVSFHCSFSGFPVVVNILIL